jgi:hypothetical protein
MPSGIPFRRAGSLAGMGAAPVGWGFPESNRLDAEIRMNGISVDGDDA